MDMLGDESAAAALAASAGGSLAEDDETHDRQQGPAAMQKAYEAGKDCNRPSASTTADAVRAPYVDPPATEATEGR